MKKRVVVSGYYGCGNTGDEAVLRGILTSLRSEGVDASVTVLSGSPSETLARHPVDAAVHRYRLHAALRALRSADLVISGGGSLLQDVTSTRSLYYYLFVIRLARLLRRRTMVFAQGIGPLTRDSSRRAVAAALDRVDSITVRDADSAYLLRQIGVTRPPVEVAADPALLIEADPTAADAILRPLGIDKRPVLGVSLRPWKSPANWQRAAVDGIRQAARDAGASVLVIPMQPPGDVEIWPAAEGDALLPEGLDVAVVKGAVARCAAVVGMRLHSLIFAAGEAAPFVALSYDPKVRAFAAAAGADALDLDSLRADALAGATALALSERDSRSESLMALRQELLGAASISARIAALLLR